MNNWMILSAVFVGAAALVGAVAMFLRGNTDEAVEERLDMLASSKSKLSGKAAQKSILLQPLNPTKGALDAFFARFVSLSKMIEQADIDLPLPKFFAISAGLALGSALIPIVMGLPPWLIPLCAAPPSILPFLYVVWKRSSRLGKFAAQMPEALELMARALRAGHSLGSGFQLVANEMKAPIATEFARVFEEQNFGIPFEESLSNMRDRIPNMDLRFFCTAIILQRQTGGDLAEILDKIGYLVRERFKIFGQVQALTGEGRLSGIVLLALPIGLFLTLLKLNPDYVMVLFTDPMGRQLLAGGVVMQLLGAVVIKKIITIKV